MKFLDWFKKKPEAPAPIPAAEYLTVAMTLREQRLLEYLRQQVIQQSKFIAHTIHIVSSDTSAENLKTFSRGQYSVADAMRNASLKAIENFYGEDEVKRLKQEMKEMDKHLLEQHQKKR
jgi:hypothetical protein